jgi:hypothetical protein
MTQMEKEMIFPLRRCTAPIPEYRCGRIESSLDNLLPATDGENSAHGNSGRSIQYL